MAEDKSALLKYVSHKTIQPDPLPVLNDWMRVCELWYKDMDAWRKVNVKPSLTCTKPPWGGEVPLVDMVSTFIGFESDIDFLKDGPLYAS